MTVDSAVVEDYDNGSRTYTTGEKAQHYNGIGCIATWGARDGNNPWSFLNDKVKASPCSIIELSDLVDTYLRQIFKPDERGSDDVGYHVAGFDDYCPRLYHVFWGFDRPRPQTQYTQEYKLYDHSPQKGKIQFLYNGRNDLAHIAVHTLIGQAKAGNALSFNFKEPLDIARFGDFVARFAAEITPEVGPPFITFMISPSNKIEYVKNDKLCPIDKDKMNQKLSLLGCI